MMNPDRSMPYNPQKRTSSLGFRLLALFGGSFLLFFALFLGWELFSGFAERTVLSAQVNSQAAPIVIDPKIADELAKVLAQDASADAFDVNDPFVDRAGLSGTAGLVTASGPLQASTGGSGSKPPSTPSKIQTVTAAGGSTNVAIPPPIESTRQRYEAWLQRAANDPALVLDPRIFAVEDLLPVGIVDGGNGGQAIMFISSAAGKTGSFPVGTMFFDGWLSEVRAEGVVFNFNDGRGTVRMQSWARTARASD
jgi:hypothetical protein